MIKSIETGKFLLLFKIFTSLGHRITETDNRGRQRDLVSTGSFTNNHNGGSLGWVEARSLECLAVFRT